MGGGDRLTGLVVDGLVLTHEGQGDGGGQTTQGSGLLGHINVVPHAGMRNTCL